MKLHDYAISHGILEMLPEFAQEMRSTMETFVVLAKQSSDSGSGGGGQAASPVVDSGASDKSPGHRRDQSSSPEVVNDVQPKSTINNSVWGYTFDTDTEIDPALTMADLTLPNSSALTQAPLGYEITTTSTFNTTPFQFDNASLESFFSQDPPTTSSPSALTTTTPTLTPPSISPYLSALSNPNTLAFTEATFGRRLQRVAIESGYQLITMASPPPARYAKAFGFCLLFEPVDKIRARLRRGIDSSRRESLNYWASPFWALGGTGQHHQLAAAAAADDNSSSGSGEEKQQQQQQQGELGNRGTVDVAKHGFGGNFGLGPFDEKTADARDRQLDPAMRMMLPGFEGEFFDPDEVEVYLRARGVRIRPGQDFVTAEVEPAWFEEGAAGVDGLWAVSPPSSSSSSSTMGGVPAWLGEDVFGDGRTVEELAGLSGGRKRIVTLDIDVLIRGEYMRPFGSRSNQNPILTAFAELVSRSVCLGRSSGFRPKDVNQAFWAATRSDNIMDF